MNTDDQIVEALASMNLSGPMRYFFGPEVGNAVEILTRQEIEVVAEAIEPIIKARVVEALRELAGDLSHSISAYDNSTWVSGFESCIESLGDRANWYEATP